MAGGEPPTPGALLCALFWAAAAAPTPLGGGPGGSPAPGAFGRLYRGAVNISAERLYAFAYSRQPGQVGASRGGWQSALIPPEKGNGHRGGSRCRAGSAPPPPSLPAAPRSTCGGAG